MMRIQAFLVLIGFVTVSSDIKYPCEEGAYPGYKGDICMKLLDTSAPYRFAERFCKIYGYEPLKVNSVDDQEYVHSLITGILKLTGEYWIGNEANNTGLPQKPTLCSFMSSSTKGIQFADCNTSKPIICMKVAYTHYIYNLASMDADIKLMTDQFNKFAFQYAESSRKLEEKLREISEGQENMKSQLGVIRIAVDNINRDHAFVENSENVNFKDRRSKIGERCAEPPFITRTPENETIVAIEGSDLDMICNASGNPVPKIQWLTKSIHMPTTGNEYRLPFISRGDAGEYCCTADNKIGPAVKECFHVEVWFRPICASHLTSLSVQIGQSVTLKCNIESNPKPEVRWHKDQMLDHLNSTTYSVGNHVYESTMKIKIKSNKDLGIYRCVVMNSVGQTTLTYYIRGAPPKIKIEVMKDETIHNHKAFRIEAKIHSESAVNDCQITIDSLNEPSTTLPVKLTQGERSANDEFIEVFESDRIGYNFSPSTNYLIKMRCENIHGLSEYSNTVQVVTYYVCGHDLTINNDRCEYLISHSEYGKSAYSSAYKCSSLIKAENCDRIRATVLEVDQAIRARCAAPRNSVYFASVQIKEKNSERNNAYNYMCSNGNEGIVSQMDQLTLEVNKAHPGSTHGFKLCFKCENRSITN